ncbi:MAG: XrtB/PEP-CTERM-associated polysaccharide biosynthesis outer membrane protein EpsL [Pseudomonadota bacterium]
MSLRVAATWQRAAAVPWAAVCVSAALCALPAHAKEGDTFRPFVSYTRFWDDNLFRLSQAEIAANLVTHASDRYGVLSAGLDVDWRPARQHVEARLSKNQVRFDRNAQLDYDGSDYQLKWNWRLGNHWSGRIGAAEKITQSSFSDLVNLQINNEITREDRFFDLNWQFHPRWSVGTGAASTTSTNSAAQQATLDYDETSYTATLGYRTPKGSTLRLQLRRVNGDYPRRTVLFLDRAYTQDEINFLGDWTVSGKLVARGRLGHVQRQNDTVSQRDFSGITGRLSADYLPTGKTLLNAALFREIANSDDANASYQLSTGASLGAAWQATSKLTLRATAQAENRRFEGDTGLLPGVPLRDEDTVSGSVSLSYAPLRMAAVEVGVQAGERQSNVPLYAANEYRFRAVFVSMRLDF